MAPKPAVSSDVEHDGVDDFELAFDLQTQEAIDASLADSFVAQEQYYEYEYTTAVSVTESVAYEDVGLMTALLLEDMEKISQEERDRQQIVSETKKLKEDLNRRIHDQQLAFEISRIPADEWDKYGDNFQRPYGNDAAVASSSTTGSSSRALVETECCRLYFKGLVSDERVKEEEVKVAAIGAAVCDPRDNLLLEVRKPVETYFEDGEVITGEMAELVALVEGLKAALDLPLDSLTFFTDDYMLYQYITGRLVPRRSKSVSFIEEVQSLQKNFTCCYPSHVARNDMKFAFKFAREAVVSQISWSENIKKRKCLKETCSICLEDTDVHRMFAIEDCLHRYCYTCMKQHVEVKLLSGNLLANCPYEGCETKVNVESCERFLDPELIKVMTQRIKESLIPFEDRVYCPFPKCSALMSKTEVLQHTKDVHIDAELSGARKCLKCGEMFCVSCQVPWHKNVSCKDYNSSSSNAQNEDLKLKSLASDKKWRRCETCRTLVELSEGCYHITCRCGHEFCYTCGAVWKKNKATCSCPIWDEHNILPLNVNMGSPSPSPPLKKVNVHPPCAERILLPDGRYLAYKEQGVRAEKARFSMIAAHSFLSSRLAGLPGLKPPLLEEFGIRLLTYDLPGFGESDPHPTRNLESSALDMAFFANAMGVNDKFWVVGYSSGGIHAWAALRYIPDKIAGAALFAPMINPYEPSMTKEERRGTWEKWTRKRKFMYFLARRFPTFLPYFYHRSFLSGKHCQVDKWLSLSMEKRDRALIEDPIHEEFWQRDVEESIRQGNAKPFVEEAVLQVSDWGFRLADLKLQKKQREKGIFNWLKSVVTEAQEEYTGFLGPIHVWQGMDDKVVPPSMTDFVHRVLPGVAVHKLPYEGHFTYIYFCDECHRQIFTTLVGTPQGPLTNHTTYLVQENDDTQEVEYVAIDDSVIY